MTHANVSAVIERRRRLVERCHSRPTTHAAAEAGVSRACLSKRENQYDTYGEAGLRDRVGVPRSAPTRAPPDAVERIEQPRWTTGGPPTGSPSDSRARMCGSVNAPWAGGRHARTSAWTVNT